jgi:multidrug resistance efflux pump
VASEQGVLMSEASARRALAKDKPSELLQAEAQRESYEAKFKQSESDLSNLVLRARKDGTVLTRKLDEKIGHMVKSGGLVMEIGTLDPMTIKMALNEKQVRYVQKGQKVLLKLDAYPGRTIEGVISYLDPMPLSRDLPAALSARRSGDVATTVDEKGKEMPIERTFEARINVENPDGVLRPGMTAHGKIYAGKRPWGQMVAQSVLDLISLDYRF